MVSTCSTSNKKDLSRHIDQIADLTEQLNQVGNLVDDSLNIGILVASIKVTQLLSVTCAIKILAEKDIKWKEVTGRSIEKRTLLLSVNRGGDRDRVSTASFCSTPLANVTFATRNAMPQTSDS